MRERLIHTAHDGTPYADKVTVLYRESGILRAIFEADPDMLYSLVHEGIVKMTAQEAKPQASDTSESYALRVRVAKLAKQALRGGLLMFGNDLLTVLYGSKEHEKPPKNVDLLDWYTDQFAKIGVAYLLKSDIFVDGKTLEADDETILHEITSIATGPVAAQLATTESNTRG